MKARQIIYSSTIIVLGFFQSVPAFIMLTSTNILVILLGIIWGILLGIFWSSTIIKPFKYFRIMFKTITKELSKNEVIDLLRGMDAQEVEDNFSVRRVLIDTQACDVFGGDPEDSYPLIPGTYMAFYYKSLVGDPYPFFEKICANLIEDEEKSQLLMNEDGCILIFMLNKYE